MCSLIPEGFQEFSSSSSPWEFALLCRITSWWRLYVAVAQPEGCTAHISVCGANGTCERTTALLATGTNSLHHCWWLNDLQPKISQASGLHKCIERYERNSKNFKKSYQEQMSRMPVFARDFHQRSLFNKDLKEKTADCNPEISFWIFLRKRRVFILGKELLLRHSSAQEEIESLNTCF